MLSDDIDGDWFTISESDGVGSPGEDSIGDIVELLLLDCSEIIFCGNDSGKDSVDVVEFLSDMELGGLESEFDCLFSRDDDWYDSFVFVIDGDTEDVREGDTEDVREGDTEDVREGDTEDVREGDTEDVREGDTEDVREGKTEIELWFCVELIIYILNL